MNIDLNSEVTSFFYTSEAYWTDKNVLFMEVSSIHGHWMSYIVHVVCEPEVCFNNSMLDNVIEYYHVLNSEVYSILILTAKYTSEAHWTDKSVLFMEVSSI